MGLLLNNVVKEGGLEKHGFVDYSLLHLIPGFIKGMALLAFIPVVDGFGYPNVLALFLANISVVIRVHLSNI